MAHRTLDSLSFGQPRAGQSHTHQVIDVKESLKKRENPKTPEPQCHHVLDLTKFLERTINVSSAVIDSALDRKRKALDLLRNRSPFPDNYIFWGYGGRPEPRPLLRNHGQATEVDLAWLFAIFNTIFFMNALPSNTRVVRRNNFLFGHELRVTLLEKRIAILTCAIVDNVHAGFERRDDHKFHPPMIDVPSRLVDPFGPGHVVVTWKDQVGSLLGSMIDLFIQYYSCRHDECWNNKYTHGKDHRGQAWQVIAYRFETSPTMKQTQEALGSPIDLQRMEDYHLDLNHWSLRELGSLESNLLRSRIETWGWAPDSQLSCVRAVQEWKRSQAREKERRAMAREKERRAMAREEERLAVAREEERRERRRRAAARFTERRARHRYER
ncbi:uncharacterized protein EAE98_007008 [Botrytis deweyae]|uniref:Uncharacterized protein n=1 Tax=Botrytis deweyae TaxID=2478750 RepID=A0ABQ7IHR8_9HELO|nr:uncharacterized protein EAE98_007008 [Botrytis deweyae]KAF7924920.1 hypothetical protein EAE98_007008 [Botrytis deweyae]